MRPSRGEPLLRDVELGHDLDAGDERVPQLHGQRHHVVEHSVDAEPDAELPLVGLDVDVGGTPLQRVHEEHVRQLDDGRGVGGPREVAEVDLLVRGFHRRASVTAGHGVEVDLRETTDCGHVVDTEGRPLECGLDGRTAGQHYAGPRGIGVASQSQRTGRPVVAVDRVLELSPLSCIASPISRGI